MLKNNMSARPDRIHAHVLKKPGVVACVQFTIIVNKSAYCQELECSTSTLPFFAFGGMEFPVLVLLSVGCKMYCSRMCKA